MKQELLYSTKLRWLDDRHLSINCYVVFAALLQKFSHDKLIILLDGKFGSGHIL